MGLWYNKTFDRKSWAVEPITHSKMREGDRIEGKEKVLRKKEKEREREGDQGEGE